MLYDAFICHANEDKSDFVHPLAEQLKAQHVKVWYDEFSLVVGDSIRRTIDKGLKNSRFGIVILSPSLFRKNWPQYELDGLVDREMAGKDKVILPVWHRVTHHDVARYSPALANRRAANSEQGLNRVVDDLLAVIRPQGSPLIAARDILLNHGIVPPVITDRYWLGIVEASNRISAFGFTVPDEASWGRWTFPLPPRDNNAESLGERLARTAMQVDWSQAAEEMAISPMTPPSAALEFIRSQPGLLDTCLVYPIFTAEYAPQLTIASFGGELEEVFEHAYKKSVAKQTKLREERSSSGSGLTVSKLPPVCDEEWILRDPNFGEYFPSLVSSAYFHSGIGGPPVSPFEEVDHLMWLLSESSQWLPKEIREVLIQGMTEGHTMHIIVAEEMSTMPHFTEALIGIGDRPPKFKWTTRTINEFVERIETARDRLFLPEESAVLFERFKSIGFVTEYLKRKKAELYKLNRE